VLPLCPVIKTQCDPPLTFKITIFPLSKSLITWLAGAEFVWKPNPNLSIDDHMNNSPLAYPPLEVNQWFKESGFADCPLS